MTKTPTILGHTPCPICPEAAQVRPDRSGLAYIYCANGCHTQVFSRDAHRDGLLRARMTPIAAAVVSTIDRSEPVPAPGPVPAAAPVRTAPPTPAKSKSTGLTTLLDK
jgi:hypothetical protein